MAGEKTRAVDVAKWFIKNKYDEPRNKYDGNMKLQKLLYFAQLIHLANYGDTLYDDTIFAYERGCVIEDIRKLYRNNNEYLIQQANAFEEHFTPEQMETLKITEEIFGNISAKELSDLNHLHLSWKEAFNKSDSRGFRCKELAMVSIESIKKYDLDKITDMFQAHMLAKQTSASYEVVNGITFYYDPEEITITDDILEKLETFNGDENAYTLCTDPNLGLVIY